MFSSNEFCFPGTCCDIQADSPDFGSCSAHTQVCYTGDGSLNVYEKCKRSSECATQCCDRFWGKCIARTDNCQPDHSLPEIIVLVILAMVLGAILVGTAIGLVVCIRKRRKQKKLSVSTKKKKPDGPKRS